MKTLGMIAFGVILVAAGYAIVRKIQHKPLLPDILTGAGDNLAGASKGSDATKLEQKPYDSLANTPVQPVAAKPSDPVTSFIQDVAKNLSDAGKSISTELQKQAVPIGVGVGATVAAVAVNAAKGVPVAPVELVKTESGIVKAVDVTKAAEIGKALPLVAGQGPAKVATTLAQTIKPAVLEPVAAVATKAGSVEAAAKIASTIGKTAGKVLGPLSIGLTAYEVASVVNDKKADTNVGDIVNAVTGVNDIAQLLGQKAPAAGGVFDTKFVDIPVTISKSVAASVGGNTQAQTAPQNRTQVSMAAQAAKESAAKPAPAQITSNSQAQQATTATVVNSVKTATGVPIEVDRFAALKGSTTTVNPLQKLAPGGLFG